jgi:iron-sulfur cluster assembly accessory protein
VWRIFKAMITLTPNAVSHLKDLLAQRNADSTSGLRLQVEKGGCAGMQYTMRIDAAQAGDKIFVTDGVSIIVDGESFGFLDQCRVDYVDSLNDSGFKIENPNAARSCGCGTSFEPRGTESGD